VVDGEGLWRSDKLARLQPAWIRAEFANLVPLARANGSFECNPRLIWSLVYAYNRPEITVEQVEQILAELGRVKLLFRWTDVTGKQWGYWVGIEKAGRLPPASRRDQKHEILGAEPPAEALQSFLSAESDGQPTASHSVVDGCLGLGLGSGSGFGINITSESSDSDMPSDAAKRERKAKPAPSQAGERLAGLLKERILQNNSSARITDKQVEQWAREADRMILRDGRSEDQIATTIEWAQQDSFWLTNILSMGKLREKFDQLTLQRKNRNPNGNDSSVIPSLERPLSERLAEMRVGLDGN
jgi:hypothetical protein